MSGLCGIVDPSGRDVDPAELAPMLAAAPYRGRGGVTTWAGPGAALAFQADDAATGAHPVRQPWVDDRGQVVIVADARIDARDEVVAALRGDLGASAESGSVLHDVELLAAAFRAWGEGGVGRLLGDFAFAAWDANERRLYAGRDAMGMRPLAYHWNGTRLTFASEVQQVVAADGVPSRLEERALVAHLLGRFEDHALTPFAGVLRVPPGHALKVDRAGPRVERHWDVDPTRRIRFGDERAYAEAFRGVFESAVRDRLRGGGDVGVLLSGGLDSGAVASMAGLVLRAERARRLHAYAWRSDTLPEVDERHLSDQIVHAFGLVSSTVDVDAHGPLSVPGGLAPSGNGPFVGVYEPLIAQALSMAKDAGVATVLSGNRGDLVVGEQVFDVLGLAAAGRWRAARRDVATYRSWRGASPASATMQLLVRPLLAEALASPWLAPLRAERSRRRAAHPGARTPRRPPWVPSAAVERAGLTSAASHGLEPPDALRGLVRRQRYRTLFTGMNLETTIWIDRLHAEAGLAYADPWSDRRLAEFVLASPQWVVQSWAEPKRLGREAMRGVMPEGVRSGATKTSPEPLYLRSLRGEAGAKLDALLARPLAADLGLVDPTALRAHLAAVRDGHPVEPTFWWALGLEGWLRRRDAV